MIAAQHLTYLVYLDRLRSLPVRDYLAPPRDEPYPHGVAEAVLLSLDAAAAADRTGLCPAVLDVISLLSAAGVPRALLYAAAQAGVFSGPGTLDGAAGPRQVDEALGLLADGSLLTFSVDDAAVTRASAEHAGGPGTARTRRHPSRPRHLGLRPLPTAVTRSLGSPGRTGLPPARPSSRSSPCTSTLLPTCTTITPHSPKICWACAAGQCGA